MYRYTMLLVREAIELVACAIDPCCRALTGVKLRRSSIYMKQSLTFTRVAMLNWRPFSPDPINAASDRRLGRTSDRGERFFAGNTMEDVLDADSPI